MKRHSTIIIILFWIALTVLFFWNETLSCNRKINDQKFSNYGTFFGFVLTGISLFLLYRQVTETIVARKAAKQPEIYPKTTGFFTEDAQANPNIFSKNSGLPIPTFYLMPNLSEKIPYPLPEIELHNIGLGAAKEILVEWIFDIVSIKEYIKDTYDILFMMSSTTSLDFIPANSSEKVKIPSQYLSTCGVRLNLDILDQIEPTIERKKPSLKLKINYKDIYDNPYSKIFDAEIYAAQLMITLQFKSTNNRS